MLKFIDNVRLLLNEGKALRLHKMHLTQAMSSFRQNTSHQLYKSRAIGTVPWFPHVRWGRRWCQKINGAGQGPGSYYTRAAAATKREMGKVRLSSEIEILRLDRDNK